LAAGALGALAGATGALADWLGDDSKLAHSGYATCAALWLLAVFAFIGQHMSDGVHAEPVGGGRWAEDVDVLVARAAERPEHETMRHLAPIVLVLGRIVPERGRIRTILELSGIPRSVLALSPDAEPPDLWREGVSKAVGHRCLKDVLDLAGERAAGSHREQLERSVASVAQTWV
jgi:hypothetical protein